MTGEVEMERGLTFMNLTRTHAHVNVLLGPSHGSERFLASEAPDVSQSSWQIRSWALFRELSQ